MNNKKIILTARPSGELDQNSFEIICGEIPKPEQSETLLKARYFSVDPYMRNRMNDVKSYVKPYQLYEPLSGDAIAEVVESKSGEFKTGDLVTAELPWQEYSVKRANQLRKIEMDAEISVSTYLSVLGLTGLSAYFGMLNIGEPKSGETVVVSGAAGAVGSVAGQIAKLKGCKVVGIAGNENKINYLKKELQFHEAINYKETKNIRKALKRAWPEGIDI